MKNNGCNEDGWDLHEEQTRKDFEFYAVRQGYEIEHDSELPWVYANSRTEDAWRMFHVGHVKGRTWNET